MKNYTLYFNPRNPQTWCFTLRNGRRYIGEYFPYTDPYYKKVLDGILDEYGYPLTDWIQERLRAGGIIDGVPVMLDADNNGFNVVSTLQMQIGEILNKLVYRHCTEKP